MSHYDTCDTEYVTRLSLSLLSLLTVPTVPTVPTYYPYYSVATEMGRHSYGPSTEMGRLAGRAQSVRLVHMCT